MIRNNAHKQLIQYNFEFIEVPIGNCWTQQEVGNAKTMLHKLFPNIFVLHIDNFVVSKIYSASLPKSNKTDKKNIINKIGLMHKYSLGEVQEICYMGNTYKICSTNNPPSLKEYKNRVDEAIKKWPNRRDQINSFYDINSGLIKLRNEINTVESFSIDIREEDCVFGYLVHINYFLGNREHNKIIKINENEDTRLLFEIKYSLKEKLYELSDEQEKILEDAQNFVRELLNGEPKNPIKLKEKIKKVDKVELVVEPKSKPVKTYLIKNKTTGFYKIGRSMFPFFRERTLQSQEPLIDIVKTWDNDIEDELHEKYKTQRVRGEWFNLSKIQVKYICTNYK